jgi:DNA replication initiation complex subunit (GINS family)
VVVGHRQPIGQRGGGPMRRARVAVETGERLLPRRPLQAGERRERGEKERGEQRQAGDAARARRGEPQAEPRGGEKQRQKRAGPGERRPDSLEDERRFGPPRQSLDRRAGVSLRAAVNLVFRFA